jgi:hypothetical protein
MEFIFLSCPNYRVPFLEPRIEPNLFDNQGATKSSQEHPLQWQDLFIKGISEFPARKIEGCRRRPRLLEWATAMCDLPLILIFARGQYEGGVEDLVRNDLISIPMGALEDIRSWASDWGFLRGLK